MSLAPLHGHIGDHPEHEHVATGHSPTLPPTLPRHEMLAARTCRHWAWRCRRRSTSGSGGATLPVCSCRRHTHDPAQWQVGGRHIVWQVPARRLHAPTPQPAMCTHRANQADVLRRPLHGLRNALAHHPHVGVARHAECEPRVRLLGSDLHGVGSAGGRGHVSAANTSAHAGQQVHTSQGCGRGAALWALRT